MEKSVLDNYKINNNEETHNKLKEYSINWLKENINLTRE
jgi:hypothetical protein